MSNAKNSRKALVALLALTLATPVTSWADRGHGWGRHGHHGHHELHSSGGHLDGWLGLSLGVLLLSDIITRTPPPQQPAVVYTQPAPAYIEAPAPIAQSAPDGYWYFCAPLGNYYPYVRSCPGGWVRVLPQPVSP